MSRHIVLVLASAITIVAAGTLGLAAPSATGVGSRPTGMDAASKSKIIDTAPRTASALYLGVVPHQSHSGYFGAVSPFTVVSVKVPTGRYALGYTFEAHHSGSFGTVGTLTCALVEKSSGLVIEPQERSVISTSDGWVSRTFEATTDIPSMSLSVQCAPTVAGMSSTEFSGVSLFALRLK